MLLNNIPAEVESRTDREANGVAAILQQVVKQVILDQIGLRAQAKWCVKRMSKPPPNPKNPAQSVFFPEAHCATMPLAMGSPGLGVATSRIPPAYTAGEIASLWKSGDRQAAGRRQKFVSWNETAPIVCTQPECSPAAAIWPSCAPSCCCSVVVSRFGVSDKSPEALV